MTDENLKQKMQREWQNVRKNFYYPQLPQPQLVDNIPCYPLLRGNITNEGLVVSDLEKWLLDMKPLSVSNIDGFKLNFEDGWLLIRVSGTEPKIRITAEAKSEARVQQLHDDGIRVIKECMTGSKET